MLIEDPRKPAPIVELNVVRLTIMMRGNQVEVTPEGFQNVLPNAINFTKREMLMAALNLVQQEEAAALQQQVLAAQRQAQQARNGQH